MSLSKYEYKGHRELVEEILGRKLTSEEIIHHFGRIDDNRPRQVFITTNDLHMKLHGKMRKKNIMHIDNYTGEIEEYPDRYFDHNKKLVQFVIGEEEYNELDKLSKKYNRSIDNFLRAVLRKFIYNYKMNVKTFLDVEELYDKKYDDMMTAKERLNLVNYEIKDYANKIIKEIEFVERNIKEEEKNLKNS